MSFSISLNRRAFVMIKRKEFAPKRNTCSLRRLNTLGRLPSFYTRETTFVTFCSPAHRSSSGKGFTIKRNSIELSPFPGKGFQLYLPSVLFVAV